ncbi:MAG: PHP domain-containing protein [Atopobiaceae bacterium]|nr:PHP domain-containing protein [Atopobiaceae bacterium]
MPALVDVHTHTSYSDGKATVEQNVVTAIAAGAETLAITDHLTLPHEIDPICEVSVAEADLAALRADIKHARAAHPELELIFGFECDWYDNCEDNIRRWSEGATFLLGSVHLVSGRWIDDPNDLSIWEDLGPDEVWRRYVDAWCDACASSIGFDTMAHPDLPQRFSREGYAATMNLQPLFERMAECAHDTSRHIEVSTAGLRKSVQAYYPAPALLGCFARAQVPVTVGSDAHVPQDVCWGISEAYNYISSAGYTHIECPCADGDWRRIELG